MGVGGYHHAPSRFTSGKETCSPLYCRSLGWSQDRVRKMLPSPELDSRTVQAAACRYTDKC